MRRCCRLRGFDGNSVVRTPPFAKGYAPIARLARRKNGLVESVAGVRVRLTRPFPEQLAIRARHPAWGDDKTMPGRGLRGQS
jgi:hypothetical protein